MMLGAKLRLLVPLGRGGKHLRGTMSSASRVAGWQPAL
jgi:hypothetical protein